VRSGTVLQYELNAPVTKLSLSGEYRQGFDDGISGVIHVRGQAELTDDLERWTGTFKVVTVLKADGKVIDRCRTRSVGLKAPLLLRDYVETGGFNVQSEPGDGVGDGESESFTFPGSGSAMALDRGRTLNFGVDSWSGYFGVDSGQLTPGTYTVGIDGAWMNVRGRSDECGEEGISGTFTITDFTHTKKLVHSAGFTFEQHCFGSTAALRGDFNYRFAPPPLGDGPLSAQPKDAAPQPSGTASSTVGAITR
jgi:hypothetical protein